MTPARSSRVLRAIPILIAVLLVTLPANAQYSGGTGEPNDPYQIATHEDLILLGETPDDYDKHFILTSDIDLDPNLPGRKVFDKAVIAHPTNPFIGSFDGSGHTISNLTIEGGSFLGLFDRLEPMAIVKNLGLEDVDVSGYSVVAGLVGRNFGSIARSYVTGFIQASGPRFWDAYPGRAGGLVGSNYGVITACYSAGVVDGGGTVGGLVGSNEYDREAPASISTSYSTSVVNGTATVGGLAGSNGGSIISCYAYGAVSGNASVGGLVGSNSVSWSGMDASTLQGRISTSYSTGTVNGDEYVGGLVGRSESPLDVQKSVWDTEASGQDISAGGTGLSTAEMQMAETFLDAGWDFVNETVNGLNDVWKIVEGQTYPLLSWQKYGGGTGDPNDPYLIYTAEHLNELGAEPNDYDKHFKLMADIDLSGYVYDRAVIAPDFDPDKSGFQGSSFSGVFAGNGHTISHLTIEGKGYLGLFGRLDSWAVISNLGLETVDVNQPPDYYGSSCVGGLVGKNGGSISASYCTGTISGSAYVGGLVGRNVGSIETSYSAVTVEDGHCVGGLVGGNSGSITACYNSGPVLGCGSVGGLVGSNGGDIASSYSVGATASAQSPDGYTLQTISVSLSKLADWLAIKVVGASPIAIALAESMWRGSVRGRGVLPSGAS
jgi:hypothetical protein